jgi:hypothetical protein
MKGSLHKLLEYLWWIGRRWKLGTSDLSQSHPFKWEKIAEILGINEKLGLLVYYRVSENFVNPLLWFNRCIVRVFACTNNFKTDRVQVNLIDYVFIDHRRRFTSLRPTAVELILVPSFRVHTLRSHTCKAKAYQSQKVWRTVTCMQLLLPQPLTTEAQRLRLARVTLGQAGNVHIKATALPKAPFSSL